jgi:hypothetical protein
MNSWSRGEKIAVVSIVAAAFVAITVAIATGLFGLLKPEFRRSLGLGFSGTQPVASVSPPPESHNAQAGDVQVTRDTKPSLPNSTTNVNGSESSKEEVSSQPRQVHSQVTPLPVDTSPTPRQPLQTDIGKTKSNGPYELTIENAKILHTSGQQDFCVYRIASGQKGLSVRFTIEAHDLSVPSINNQGDTDFLVVDAMNNRFERTCGDGRYFNVSYGDADPRPKTITLVYVIPSDSEGVIFRFQHTGKGQPVTFDLSGLH